MTNEEMDRIDRENGREGCWPSMVVPGLAVLAAVALIVFGVIRWWVS